MTAEKFGRYVIKAEIGRGGMATVFHAYDPRFERDVAIKVLPREFLHDPQFRVRFEREAKTVAMLEHPAIVPVYDFGEDEEDQPYIVMRFMSGGSLADKIQAGPMPLDEVIDLFNRLAPALGAAHSKGIIHRDLKPANILYDQYGNGFLSDFGIAHLGQATALTLTGGAILGTPAYMSPEQVSGGAELDGRSDIYALGVILYQVLAGKTPYRADTAPKLMMMHLLDPVPHILDEKADLPPEFDAVIETAMAKKPEERFQSAAEMATAIRGAAANASQEALSSGAPGAAGDAKTHYRPPATLKATPRKPESQPAPRNLATRVVPPAEAAPVVRKKSLPVWAWAVGMLVILAAMAGIALGSGVISLGSRPTPTTLIQAAPSNEFVAAAASSTPTPEPTATQPPTATFAPTMPTVTLALTATPAPTDTALSPTQTLTPLPLFPVIGGADKIAFLNDNDIWMVNLDGSDLVQLTNDGATKTSLQWTPDGAAVVYISGLCIQMVTIENNRIDNLACFEYVISLDAFQISPDGLQAAIVVNQELYLIPFDAAALANVDYWTDIQAMASCAEMAPYASSTGTAYAVREAYWSRDMSRLAVVLLAAENGQQVEIVRVMDISTCQANPPRVDEFPSTRFSIDGYNNRPEINHLGYDGMFLFTMNSIVRNDGYGNLYLYNMDQHRAELMANPVNGACCYQDAEFSPDGSYLAFAFQDINLGAAGSIQLYYISYGSIGTGRQYTPIPLPDGFFTNPRQSPQPALRPAAAP